MIMSRWFRFARAAQALMLAALLVATGSVAALAQDDEGPSNLEGELTFWHGMTAEADVFNNTVLPAFEEQYPNVTVEVLQVPFDQLKNKYNTEASAGGGPDVLLGPPDWVGEFVDAEIIRPINELTEDDLAAEYNEAAVGLFSRDDTLYAVPQNINGVALFYNKLLVPEPPMTTEELVAAVGEFEGTDNMGLGIFPQFYNNAAYLYGFGGQALTEDGSSGFDSQETIEWLTFLQDLSNTPGVEVGADQAAIESLFNEGKLGMMINGPWFVGAATENLGEENVGVAILPAVSENDNEPAKPFVGGSGLYINSNLDDDQAALALEFARWYSTTGTEPMVAEAGQLPAANDVEIPADNTISQAFVEQYENAVPLPNDPKMGAVWTPADDMLSKVLSGDVAPTEAAQSAAETINSAGS
jgi:arabinogalactan oligomer/maltooligosaccharide transport system substrate-binding protein